MPEIPKELQAQVDQGVALERQLVEQMASAKQLEGEIKAFWKQVETQMIEHNIKNFKGDWGSITIVERNNFKASLDEVPPKFIKKTLDTTKIGKYFTLEGKLPKGVERSITKFLMRKIK